MISSLMNMAKLSQFAKICYMCIKVCFFLILIVLRSYFEGYSIFGAPSLVIFYFLYLKGFNFLKSLNFRLSSLNHHFITDLVHYYFCYLLRDSTVRFLGQSNRSVFITAKNPSWPIFLFIIKPIFLFVIINNSLFRFLDFIEVVFFYDY